ncbi:MAG: IS21 family transposase [Candidatus Babeliales bacterium]
MERTSMRKIREVLRLKYESNLSNSKIALSCNLSRESVRNYLARAEQAGLIWPLPEEMDDQLLEQRLFPTEYLSFHELLPDWLKVHEELKKKGVTRWLLWEEYKANYPDGIQYSRFCQLYRAFKNTLQPVMRQTHKAGEKLFVDFSGLTVPWVDKNTGEIHQAEIFVAVLGASNYTYIEAFLDQSLPSWIKAHVNSMEFLGGVPSMIVPDNLKAAVTKAHRYDPGINQTYQDFACHYGTAVIPTRAAAPRDKAKVEVGVQIVERCILAPLRHHTFFSVAEINVAIKPLLKAFNERPFQKLIGSRLSQFETIDKPALQALPLKRYQYAQWKNATVNIDYHIALDKHYYSVPYTYIKKVIAVRITQTSVECFYKNRRIAHHRRAFHLGHTTQKEHMPKAHQDYCEWTPERLAQWAKKIGPATAELIDAVIASRAIPQQAYRACLGILRLGKRFNETRLESAAKRALALGALRYQSIESILKNGLEQQPLPVSSFKPIVAEKHEHIRGANYYD